MRVQYHEAIIQKDCGESEVLLCFNAGYSESECLIWVETYPIATSRAAPAKDPPT